MSSEYIPQSGDIILLDKDRIPTLVISPKEYNGKTGMAIFCQINERIRNYPFEVKIPENSKISGVILSDRINTLNWKSRNTEFLLKLPKTALKKVILKLKMLL